MPEPRFIICNCSYGNNPYLSTTKLALAVNDELENRGMQRHKIIVPAIYGEKQKKILKEEFPGEEEIILDEKYGRILGSVLFKGKSYEQFLNHWLENTDTASKAAQRHIKETYGDAVSAEVSRAAIVQLEIQPSYNTSFAYLSEIWERAARNSVCAVNDDTLKKASRKMRELESAYSMHFLTKPGTFSWEESEPARHNEVHTPPILTVRDCKIDVSEPSAYVTVSGIPNTQGFSEIVSRIDLPLYTNNPDAIHGATEAPPRILTNENIVLHIARAGWGSVWSSLITETPLIVPMYNPKDDPEVYFNTICIEKIGVGIIYRSKLAHKLHDQANELKPNMQAYKEKLRRRFGTLNGTRFIAKRIVEHWLKEAK